MQVQGQTEAGSGMTPVEQRSGAETAGGWPGDFQYCPTCDKFVWVVTQNAAGQYPCPTCGAVTEERALPF